MAASISKEGLLSPLDESFQHQVALPFDLAGTSDHRFFDRTVVTAGAPDGTAGVILGIAAYKNLNVLDGFAAVQVDCQRQLNLRLSRGLRPDLSPTLGPLRMEVVEPFETVRFILEEGTAPFAFDLTLTKYLPPHVEQPHFHRAGGRVTQDYVRFNQLMAASGTVRVEGRDIVADRWFAWRDHSWGVRPGVGGFEPPMPGVTDAFPSAARAGGKGMLLFYIGFNVDEEIGGGLQGIETGDGEPIYLTGEIGSTDRLSRVTSYDWSVDLAPGSRMPREVRVVVTTEDDREWRIVARPTGRPWAYKGLGYDAGYDDGLGQGVWRGAGLYVEQDVYDLSDPELIGMPDGRRVRANHREVHVAVEVNGRAGYGYMPFVAIGDIARFAS